MSAVATLFSSDEPIFRLSVDQYHSLIQSGILTSDDPVELLEGILVRKMSKNPPHSNCNGRVQQVIGSAIEPGWCFRLLEPVTLSDGEPEPDGVVACGSIDDYSNRHPNADDILLVIEVADTSLDRDRGIKLRSYARAGIVCYWIINLIDRQIEVNADPDPVAVIPTFRNQQIFKIGQTVSLNIDGRLIAEIPVDHLLPAS